MKSVLQNLRSRRLCVRLLCADDALSFFRYVTSDLETVRYVQWPVQTSPRESQALVATFLAAIESGEKFYFAAEDTGGCPVGFASMKFAESSAAIGFVIAASQRRLGYATELISLLAETAFRFESVRWVEGFCDIDNLASARSMMKAGFARAEVLPKRAIHPNTGSEPRDLVRYVRHREAIPRDGTPVAAGDGRPATGGPPVDDRTAFPKDGSPTRREPFN